MNKKPRTLPPKKKNKLYLDPKTLNYKYGYGYEDVDVHLTLGINPVPNNSDAPWRELHDTPVDNVLPLEDTQENELVMQPESQPQTSSGRQTTAKSHWRPAYDVEDSIMDYVSDQE